MAFSLFSSNLFVHPQLKPLVAKMTLFDTFVFYVVHLVDKLGLWHRLPVILGAAYLGLRRHLHQRYNLLHVGDSAGKDYDHHEFWYRTADGKCNHPQDHLIGSQGTFFGRNMLPSTSRFGAGEDKFTVTWSFNKTTGSDSDYKMVKVKLCYAPVSQKGRGWRKTKDELKKDKTCQFKVVSRPYNSANAKESFEYTVKRDVPQATYFVRAYVYDAADEALAFGQTTDANKTTNLFVVNAVSGRHMSMDIASICFSAFSILSLAGFFIAEKRRAKNK